MKNFLLLLALCLLISSISAKTATEAITYISQEKHMLSDNETATIYPLVKISYNSNNYWVVSILSGTDLLAFIPVEETSFTIPSKTLTNTEIIKLAYFLRLHDDIKTNAQKQSIWLFNLENEKFFSDLSTDYYNETFEIETVKTELPSTLYSQCNTLKTSVNSLSNLSKEISSLITSIRETEQSFYSLPSDTSYNELNSQLDSFFSKLSNLDTQNKTYLSNLNTLKLDIAKLSLEADTKQSLNSILNQPNKSNSIATKTNYSLNIKESLESAKTKSETDSFEIASSIPARIQRGQAYSIMYSFDEQLFSQTNAKTLKELIEQLNSNDYTDKWQDQTSLQKVNEYWKKAEIYYSSTEYTEAISNSKKAREKALLVYTTGLKPSDNQIQIPTEILIILVLSLVAVYVYQNKDKFFKKKEEDADEKNPFSL